MAKLFSHHDRFHIHAVLGLLALLNFFVRFCVLFATGRCSLEADTLSALSLGVHVALHATSFQFELPRNRQWSKPMIWKEFRVHNAIFAYRHLIAAALGIMAPGWWIEDPTTASSLLVKVALAAATMKAADVATEKLGCTDKRTTNAMPYPPELQGYEHVFKWFYAKSQFAATSLALFGTPTLSLLSVLGIEIASFLMTLVRKGLILPRTYHACYAASLFIMFPAIVRTLHGPDELASVATFRALGVCFVACELRMSRQWNKYLASVPAVVIGAVAGLILVNMGWHKYGWHLYISWIGMIWSAVDTLQQIWSAKKSSHLKCSAVVKEGENKEPLNSAKETLKASPESEVISAAKWAGS